MIINGITGVTASVEITAGEDLTYGQIFDLILTRFSEITRIRSISLDLSTPSSASSPRISVSFEDSEPARAYLAGSEPARAYLAGLLYRELDEIEWSVD